MIRVTEQGSESVNGGIDPTGWGEEEEAAIAAADTIQDVPWIDALMIAAGPGRAIVYDEDGFIGLLPVSEVLS